ncbi:unnamed protein product [Lampetra planeri]
MLCATKVTYVMSPSGSKTNSSWLTKWSWRAAVNSSAPKLVGRPEEEDKFVLDLHHVTVSGFAPLLEYAYTSTLSISTENIIDVLAAASYMQMFAVASTCSEFMKSSILWSSANNGSSTIVTDKPHESVPESASSNCALTPLDGSVSPVSSDCSIMERNVPICRESRRETEELCYNGITRESAEMQYADCHYLPPDPQPVPFVL